jgi:hypothetical protein
MSKEMPDHPQNARVADAIAQDAVRRPGPAAPAWSESSLEKRAAVSTEDYRLVRRPRRAVIGSLKRSGSGG